MMWLLALLAIPPGMALTPQTDPGRTETLSVPTWIDGNLVAAGVVHFDSRGTLDHFTLAGDGSWKGRALPTGTEIIGPTVCHAGGLVVCGVHFTNGERACVDLRDGARGATVTPALVGPLVLRPGKVAVECPVDGPVTATEGVLDAPANVQGVALGAGDAFTMSRTTGLSVAFAEPRILHGARIVRARWAGGHLAELTTGADPDEVDGYPVAPYTTVTFGVEGDLHHLALATPGDWQGFPIAAGDVWFGPGGTIVAARLASGCVVDGHALAAGSSFFRNLDGSLYRYTVAESDRVGGRSVPAGSEVDVLPEGGFIVRYAQPLRVGSVHAVGFRLDPAGRMTILPVSTPVAPVAPK